MPDVFFNPDPNLYPDPSGRAQRMIRFISNLTIWEGDFAGNKLQVSRFQEAVIRRIYGPCDEDGNRLARIVCWWMPRGNTKTTSAAALGLGHFMGPEAEAGGQIIMAAADRGNAGIAFNHGFQFVNQDPELSKRVNPIVSQKEMHHLKNKSLFKAISTESYSKHGLNVSFFLADELHAWPPTEARKLWKVITDSMVKRSNPLTIVISTAGEGVGGLAFDMWEYSHQVARGEIIDPSFVPIIFGAKEDQDWEDEETWKFANPILATSFGGSLLKELRNKIKRTKFFPTDAADFKRFHLNLWVEGSASPWIDPETYDKCEERINIEVIKDQNRGGFIGVDLSSVEDLTSVVIVFPDDEEDLEERGFDIFPMFFLPEEGLAKKSDRDQANYLKWVEAGYLKLTKGKRIDQKVIQEYVVEQTKEFNILEISVDRWNSTAFVTALQERDLEVVEFGQGFSSMAGPVKEIKSTILSGKFRHGNNPVLRMCFMNVVTEKDAAENEKFTKAKARGRIDGATASANAIGSILIREKNDESYDGYYGKTFTPKVIEPEDDGISFDYEILNNMKHPLFQEHKARFERWQDRNADREDF